MMENQHDTTNGRDQADLGTPRVTGVGGIFFFSDNPEELKAWYAKHFGMVTDEWGSTFSCCQEEGSGPPAILQWSPFKRGSDYFAPSSKEFMINYRVQHLEGLVAKLQADGIVFLDDIETFEYGKFIHLLDPEGNKLELWEPA